MTNTSPYRHPPPTAFRCSMANNPRRETESNRMPRPSISHRVWSISHNTSAVSHGEEFFFLCCLSHFAGVCARATRHTPQSPRATKPTSHTTPGSGGLMGGSYRSRKNIGLYPLIAGSSTTGPLWPSDHQTPKQLLRTPPPPRRRNQPPATVEMSRAPQCAQYGVHVTTNSAACGGCG